MIMRILKRLAKLGRPNLRVILAALCAIGILHIIATLTAPLFNVSTAYARLEPVLPVNKIKILPPVTPEAQPLPFLTPDVRYAMCRYDATAGPVTVTAVLPGRGWSLALHTPDGDNVYSATGRDDRSTTLRLRIVPTEDRFFGMSPEALGRPRPTARTQTVESSRGIAIIRAPDKGEAYNHLIEADLRRARCSWEPF
ncbi:conserved exported protein of unknown function [Candidatus Filomicrobium marinum]|uniref:DUF1254 domain-containing protein n=3 Tax=Hyphomicrobiaceae TaxID=45401 RepID=A0A0D6JJ75_9HYPH|nr:conserved exported protein of unknown function [Candidatus Filomicrobium marinum]CPR22034.1 conserved exported protein of unknown function [Candidatus Filomicrobium marinum]SDP45465.1 Uncharacterized membrane protein [Filomicrobium insigne]